MKFQLPDNFTFYTSIPVRITDLNYGGHVANDTVLSIIHEARVRFLHHHGYSELNLGGPGLIMKDVTIHFKKELFYGDVVKVWVSAHTFSKVAFDLYYKLEKEAELNTVMVAMAKTGMVCYDYKRKRLPWFLK